MGVIFCDGGVGWWLGSFKTMWGRWLLMVPRSKAFPAPFSCSGPRQTSQSLSQLVLFSKALSCSPCSLPTPRTMHRLPVLEHVQEQC